MLFSYVHRLSKVRGFAVIRGDAERMEALSARGGFDGFNVLRGFVCLNEARKQVFHVAASLALGQAVNKNFSFHTVLSVGSCHDLRRGVSSVRDFLTLSRVTCKDICNNL